MAQAVFDSLTRTKNIYERRDAQKPALFNCGYDPTSAGWVVREGSREGEHVATFKRESDADAYVRSPPRTEPNRGTEP